MTIFTGSFRWRMVSRSPISIAKPPSPDSEITCRSGKGELRADRLRHRVRHRAVAERAEQAPLTVHRQVARRPQRRQPDVAGEDGVGRRELVDDAREVLRVNRRCAGLARRQLVERAPRLRGSARARVEVLAIDFRCRSAAGAPRASSSRRRPGPDRAGAAPQILGTHVDLRDLRLFAGRTADTESRCRASAARRSPSSRSSPTRNRAARSCRRRTDCRIRRTPCRASRARSAPSAPRPSRPARSWAPAQPAPARIVIFVPLVEQPRRAARARRRRGAARRALAGEQRSAQHRLVVRTSRSATSPGDRRAPIRPAVRPRCGSRCRATRGICSGCATGSQ